MRQDRQEQVVKRGGLPANQAKPTGTEQRSDQTIMPGPEFETKLGTREVEVLQRVATGQSRKQIADALYISPFTVHTHLKNIYAKLDAHNRIEALNIARGLGFVE